MPKHPQTKGQAVSMNKTIVSTLKNRLEQSIGKWADELLGVLWCYRITTHTSTNETPFLLAFGAKAIILVETRVLTVHTNSHQHTGTMNKLTSSLIL